MSIDLSLADVFAEAFGYKTNAFKPEFSKLPPQKKIGSKGSDYYSPNFLGQEYYLPVRLMYIESATPGVSPGGDKKTIDIYLPHPVITVTGRKTIIETPLTERRGTVKEIISLNDYEIIIKGLIIGADNEYPEEEVMKLRDVFEMNVAVSISNPITDIFLMSHATSGSDKVVIKELSFPEVVGKQNVRPYQMTMISDAPFNLIDLK